MLSADQDFCASNLRSPTLVPNMAGFIQWLKQISKYIEPTLNELCCDKLTNVHSLHTTLSRGSTIFLFTDQTPKYFQTGLFRLLGVKITFLGSKLLSVFKNHCLFLKTIQIYIYIFLFYLYIIFLIYVDSPNIYIYI